MQEFIKWKYRLADISLAQINYEFLGDFEFFLKSEKNIAHNTTAKYIKNIKKIINDCLSKGWLKSNPFMNYKIAIKSVDRTFLSEAELDRLMNKEL